MKPPVCVGVHEGGNCLKKTKKHKEHLEKKEMRKTAEEKKDWVEREGDINKE